MSCKLDLEGIFHEHINTIEQTKLAVADRITAAGFLLIDALAHGGKVLSCGNGGSASDALHFTGELVNRFLRERAGLAAISLVSDVSVLTAISNDYSYQHLFARQIQALGKAEDVLLAISTSGNSANVIQGIQVAHEVGMRVIALVGNGGGKIRELLRPEDVEIAVPSDYTPRIQEAHILIIHCLCEFIDNNVKVSGV